MIDSHVQTLSNEDLIAIQAEEGKEKDDDVDEQPKDSPSQPAQTLTAKKVSEALTHLDKFLSIMEERDPNAEISSQVRRAVERDIACYRLLYQ